MKTRQARVTLRKNTHTQYIYLQIYISSNHLFFYLQQWFHIQVCFTWRLVVQLLREKIVIKFQLLKNLHDKKINFSLKRLTDNGVTSIYEIWNKTYGIHFESTKSNVISNKNLGLIQLQHCKYFRPSSFPQNMHLTKFLGIVFSINTNRGSLFF